MEFEQRVAMPRMVPAQRVGWFHLERPVFIGAGERFWTTSDALVLESASGAQRRCPGFLCR